MTKLVLILTAFLLLVLIFGHEVWRYNRCRREGGTVRACILRVETEP